MIWLLVDGSKCSNYRQQDGATFMKKLKLHLTVCSILCTTGFLWALHKEICIGTVTGDLKSKYKWSLETNLDAVFLLFLYYIFLLFVVCCMCIDGAIIDMSICTQVSVFRKKMLLNRQIKYTGQLMYFTLTWVWCFAKHYSCTLFGFSNCRIIKVWSNLTHFVNIRFPRNRIIFVNYYFSGAHKPPDFYAFALFQMTYFGS